MNFAALLFDRTYFETVRRKIDAGLKTRTFWVVEARLMKRICYL